MPRCAKIRGKVVMIKVSEETRRQLTELKRFRENYDQVIRRLISNRRHGKIIGI